MDHHHSRGTFFPTHILNYDSNSNSEDVDGFGRSNAKRYFIIASCSSVAKTWVGKYVLVLGRWHASDAFRSCKSCFVGKIPGELATEVVRGTCEKDLVGHDQGLVFH